METLDVVETTGDAPDPGGGVEAERTPLTAKQKAQWALGIAAVIGVIVYAFFEAKIRTTITTVVIAVAVSGGLWIGANLLFNQVRSRWVRFNTITLALIGGLVGIVIHGNQLTLGSGGGFFPWLLGPLVGSAALGGIGMALARDDDPDRRRLVAVGGSVAIGLLIGLLMREEYHPGLDAVAIIAYTLVLAAVGAGIGYFRKHPPVNGALIGAAIGWLLGAWGAADLGDGSLLTSVIAALVPCVLIGVRHSMTPNPDYQGRVNLERRSRAVIFLGPALLFITVLLVVPAIRTAYLSLLDRDSEDWVGLDNYTEVFTDRDSFDTENWSNMFTSVPFIIGIVLLVIAVFVGRVMKQRTGRAVEIGNPTVGPLVFGFLLVSFGVFTALRGTIFNNLWWVVVVTFASTALGLAIAVLADQRGGEKLAKSIIFMPMAISLVGASIIWRFVYLARDTSTEQTGVMNALWVGLGSLSTGSGIPTILFGIFLGAAVLGLLALVARLLTTGQTGRAVAPGVAALLVGWFFIRYVGIIGEGVGGFQIDEDGEVSGQTIFFVQETPYNNVWLMVIFIWIQTGFSMVILSAAIKAVPAELIEAAKIDGANNSQVFWRVTLPQIATTIGVVVTTLIVGVMKVYDIVKVTTNGQFGTQVLANNMFAEAFSFQNTGKGAALAMLIFISVLPVMIFNIRRMQRGE